MTDTPNPPARSTGTAPTPADVAARRPAPGESSGASRVRSRLARFAIRPPSGVPALDPLMLVVRANHPKADLSVLERAYTRAEAAHRGQLRRSGDPYITHPVAVASILADLGMTPPTLAAALLHDT